MSDEERDAMRQDDHSVLSAILRMVQTIIAAQSAAHTASERRFGIADERISRTESEVAALRDRVDAVAASTARIETGVSALSEQMRSMDSVLAERIERERKRPRAWLFFDNGGVRALAGLVALGLAAAAAKFAGAPQAILDWLGSGS